MLQNLDLNIPMKWENSEIDSAVQVFASQGFSLITSRRVTNWAQSMCKYRKSMEYKEKGGKEGETTLFLFSQSVHPSYLSNYYFKDICSHSEMQLSRLPPNKTISSTP